jgi:4-amino-4-deoxy-L-arabinose transferase-like glycosyltransferase
VQNIAHSLLRSCLFLALIALGTIFFRLGGLPLTGADEPRYARIAEEMYQQGNWVTPLLEGLPWLEKPPLYYWITIPFIALLGNGEMAARLGPALSGLLTAAAIFWLGARLWNRLTGLIGASIILTCVGLAGFARGASTDIPMTACLTAALSILMAAAVERKFAFWKIAVTYIFLGLAILGKGPVAIGLAGGICLIFWFFDERGGSFRGWHVSAGLAITMAVVAPWFWLAFRQNGYSFISIFFINHNLARYVSDIHHHTQPFFYYLPILLGLFFPWTGWLLLLIPKSLKATIGGWRSWDPRTLFLGSWIIFPLLFFTFSASKLAGYILPSLPPLALLLGAQISKWQSNGNTARITRVASWTYLVFSTGVAVATPLFFNSAYGGHRGVGLILALAVLVPAIFGFRSGLQGKISAAFKATVLQGFLIIILTAQLAFPILGDYLSTKSIALRTLSLKQPGESIATFLYSSHSFNYYTGYQVSDSTIDLETLARLVRERQRILVVTPSKYLESIRRMPEIKVVVSGQYGNLTLMELTN